MPSDPTPDRDPPQGGPIYPRGMDADGFKPGFDEAHELPEDEAARAEERRENELNWRAYKAR